MKLAEWRQCLFCPCVAILALWALLLWPSTVMFFCPAVWTVDKRPNFWQLLKGDFRFMTLLPQTILAIAVFGYSAALIGVINAFLPRFVSQAVNRCAMFFLNCSVLPIIRILWRAKVFSTYLIAYALSVQSCRYSAAQADSAISVGHAAGAVFVLSVGMSTKLYAPSGIDSQWYRFACAALASLIFFPLTLIVKSGFLGFLPVLAFHTALTLLLAKLASLILGDDPTWKTLLCCGASASMTVFVSLASLQAMGVSGAFLLPFAMGGACLGHVAYFVLIALLSSSWVVKSVPIVQEQSAAGLDHDSLMDYLVTNLDHDYVRRQGVVVISLAVALFIGKVFDVPALNGTAHIVFVLWIMTKEVELKLDSWGMKMLAFTVLYQFLDKEAALSMFDPHGLYV